MQLKLSKSARGWLTNILIILAVYWAVQFYQSRESPSSGPAPEIEGVTLNGNTLSLHAQKGQPVLIYFWATWCSVCALTKESINDIAQDHQVITIASQSGSSADIQKYVRA